MKRLWLWLGKIFLTAAALNLVIELISRRSPGSLFSYVTGSPAVFLVNTLMMMVPFLPVFFTERKVFLTGLVSLLELTMGVINGVLLLFRTTPFTATDLHMFNYGLRLLPVYLSLWQILLLSAAAVLAAAGCVLLWRRAPKEEQKVNLTESACVAAVGLAVVWGALNMAILSGTVALHFGNIGQAYQDYGFAYCFANSAFNTGIEKPEDYGTEVVEEILADDLVSEQVYSLKEHQRPNLIMLQLESFFDPTLWENNPLQEDPIPLYHFLMKNFPSGYLSVPSVGAGTANTEFECITGMNLDFFGPGEYPYKTVLQKKTCESVAFNMKDLGYHTHAIHNNEATFYDRHKVFPQLGFETFTPIEYMYQTERNPTGWCKDKVLTGEIEAVLDSTLGQDFIYTISVQGHGKYPSFAYYGQQIHEMDQFTGELISMLIDRNEPTVLVLYGDHLPGFEWSEEEMKNRSLFQTEYVVWNNMNLPKERRDVESYQLAAYVLDLLDIHEGTMTRFHQRYLESEPEDASRYPASESDADFQHPASESETTSQYLAAMKILEYDMLYGDQEVYGGASPFRPVPMEYGVRPIIQKTTVHNGDQITVFGENFNSYSRIFVDGKEVETPYYQEGRLIATGVPFREGEEITVRQVGRDRVPLGTARKKRK